MNNLLNDERLKYINDIRTHLSKEYSTTEIAKELNLGSAYELNEMLCKDGIQFNINGEYILCAEYENNAYTRIIQTVLDNGKIVYNKIWTDLGREFILKKYSQVGFGV